MKVKSIAECSPGGILEYLWPALSDNWSYKPIFCRFENVSFAQILLYLIQIFYVFKDREVRK